MGRAGREKRRREPGQEEVGRECCWAKGALHSFAPPDEVEVES